MSTIKKIAIPLISIALFGWFGLGLAEAATFDLSLEKEITSSKDDIVVIVSVNSDGKDVNAAQAKISFPTSLLEVSKVDRADSVFSFWLEEPTFANDKGTVSFVGGSTSGFTGSSLKVMKIAFRVKGSGKGQVGVTDGAITASDGSGSNVYSSAKGLDINIPTTAEFASVKLERSVRQAELVKILPKKPDLNVPYYSDPTKWQNRSASFQATWLIGSDVSQAGIALDNSPSTNPSASGEALTGSKVFPALADGVYYLHLRLANNIGWGTTNHYRLAIDTKPPSSFKIVSAGGLKINSATPALDFASSDTGSGIDHYDIYGDNQLVTTTASSSLRLPPTRPGNRQIKVVATDRANNSTSQILNLEILPITSPTIASFSRQVVVDEENLTANGTALPEAKIIAQVFNASNQVVVEQLVPTDTAGKWDLVLNKALPIGKYHLVITAQDTNLNMSLPVLSGTIAVRNRPLLMIGSIAITATFFYLAIILLLAGAFAGGWGLERWFSRRRRERIIIAERDVANAFTIFRKDVEKVKKGIKAVEIEDSAKKSELIALLDGLIKSNDKLMPYLKENISDIE
ncbi:MAG: cohesin domain-containing protein [Candidatus Vogelbacteria bacterium]|nr:cohesin domain-containing protein [Candidatus Vogelbacteria bacterium]